MHKLPPLSKLTMHIELIASSFQSEIISFIFDTSFFLNSAVPTDLLHADSTCWD